MRNSIRFLQVSAALGALCALSSPAGLINLGDSAINLSGGVIGGTLTGTVTYNNGANSENCYAGIFGLSVNNPAGSPTSGSILTFCTDVGANWNSGQNYTALQFAGATGVNPLWANTPKSIENVAWLYNQYFIPNSGSYISDPNQAAGMQLAIWKLLYDTASDGSVTALDNANGNLRATGFGSGVADANTLLGYVNSARSGGTFTTYLDTWLSPNGGNNQGMIYTNLTPVPEPTTIIAGALLLLPFGASTVRMLRKSRVA